MLFRSGAGEQRVSVGRGARDNFSTNNAAGAATIIDDDLLAKRFGEFAGYGACNEVGGAARAVGHDEAKRTRGESLRTGVQDECEAQKEAGQDLIAHRPIIMARADLEKQKAARCSVR